MDLAVVFTLNWYFDYIKKSCRGTSLHVYCTTVCSVYRMRGRIKLSSPGDGYQAAEVLPCTSWLNNMGTQSHGSL